MENHVKDEQIRNQSETIASLERKVESLERELQKCLDPDSGTVTPTWGPAAPVLVKDECFMSRMQNIIASVFMPISFYNDYQNKFQLRSTQDVWWTFRANLIGNEECKHLFDSSDFREAINSMNRFIDDISIRVDEFSFDGFTSTAEVLLESTTPQGWQLVMEGLKTIERHNVTEGSYIFTPHDLQDLWIVLQTIHNCVKMYHAAVDPEKREDKE